LSAVCDDPRVDIFIRRVPLHRNRNHRSGLALKMIDTRRGEWNMRTRLFVALIAATALAPAALHAQGSTVGGAVGGAAVGGVVGGPPGAAVGAVIGGTIGAIAEPPREVVTFVERDRSPSVVVEERVIVGEPLPPAVELRAIPEHTEYRFAVVNNQRVIVEPRSRRVIKIIN
jgi:hypothetical protein